MILPSGQYRRAFALVLGLIALSATFGHTRRAEAIPRFSHQFKLRCISCHALPPKLNRFGEDFVARGYRLPESGDRKAASAFPVSAWISGRYEDQKNRFKKGFGNRVELISAGPIGPSRASYFVEWRPLSLETRGDGTLRDRSGRFEDLYVNWQPDKRSTLTLGQYRALRQVDVSRRLTVTEPILFSTSLPGDPDSDSRITSLRSFAPSGRSPGVSYQYQSVLRDRPSDGLFHIVTLPFVGELSIPLTDAARDEASFELEGPPKGVFLETFDRKGSRSIGVHAFLDNDRWLLQGVGTFNKGNWSLTGGLGVDERDDRLRERYSLEGEYLWNRSDDLRWALGLRLEHLSKTGRDPALLPYLALSGPNTRGTFLMLVQYRALEQNNALFVELGAVF